MGKKTGTAGQKSTTWSSNRSRRLCSLGGPLSWAALSRQWSKLTNSNMLTLNASGRAAHRKGRAEQAHFLERIKKLQSETKVSAPRCQIGGWQSEAAILVIIGRQAPPLVAA